MGGLQDDQMRGTSGLDLPLYRTPRGRSQELWGRLRKEHRRVVTQMRRADLEPLVLVHGVQLLRRSPVPLPVLYVGHISEQRRLVSVDCAGTVRWYYEDGQLCSTWQAGSPLSGLLYAAPMQRYVAWSGRELLLYDHSFMLLSRTLNQEEVSMCMYHPRGNLLLSAGGSTVITWSFVHCGRSLVQLHSLSGGMLDEEKVTAITVDPDQQTCYVARGTSVWEYDLRDGHMWRVRRHLHARAISCLLYCKKLHHLISGSRDGSIKVWDSASQLLTVYLGHDGPVTALSLISAGTVLVSGSGDASLRTWSLHTQEQMEELKVSGSILGLKTFCSNGDYIVSYTSQELQVWEVQHLYRLHCLLGTAVTTLTTSEDMSPPQVLCVCADSTVRVLTSCTGEIVATLEVGEQVLGAEYCAPHRVVCTLLADGQLVKASARTNPMRVLSRMRVSHPPRCFTLFKAEKEVAQDHKVWATGQQDGEDQVSYKRKSRLFCIIGLDNGSLQVYRWLSDQPQCEIEAHPGHVTHLMSIPEQHYIVSAGSDLTVKVWRFYPYSVEGLSLCMSLYCSQPLGHICSLNSQLFVALRDSSSATYTLVQYCLKTGRRSDHPSNHDHQDQITGLCASPELGLVASCGRDRTIRVWTEENRLLRLLCLQASPESLSFCSSQGDLLVGIHGHIYGISLMDILPQPYKLKMMCVAPPPAVPDPSECHLLKDSMEDTMKPTPPYRPIIRNKEDSLCVEKRGQEEGEDEAQRRVVAENSFLQEVSALSLQEQDLRLLQMGKLKAQKPATSNKETRGEAMKRYLQIIYQENPSHTIPEVDDFDAEELLRAPGVQEPQIIVPEKNRGFFTDSASGFSIDYLPQPLQASISAAGVIPNSALLQLLWPMEIKENIKAAKRSREVLAKCLPAMVEQSERTHDQEEEVMKTIEEKTEETDEAEEDVPPLLQDILALVSAKKVSPPVLEAHSPAPKSPPAQSHKLERPTRPQKTRLSRIPRPPPVQTKLLQKPLIPVQLPPSPPPLFPHVDLVDKMCFPSPVDSQEDDLSVKSPQMSVVPEMPPYILQFQDESWFSMVLPAAEEQYSDFESRLLLAFLQAGQPMATQLLDALQTLHQQRLLKDPQQVLRTLQEVISREVHLRVHEEQDLVWRCLRFMNDLFPESMELILELLVTCVQLQAPHRGRFIALLYEFGIHDPHGFIFRKCSSWDSLEDNSREALEKICADWLHQWTILLIDHLRAAATRTTQPPASHGGKSGRHGRSLETKRHKKLRSYDITPIDVLNYYCDVQMKIELQVMKDCEPKLGSTVLALPPIHRRRALLRLGETGTNGRPQQQADGGFPGVRTLLHTNIIPFINLPVKKVTLSPFPSMEVAPTRPQFTGSLRQDIHRYFIVHQSHLERY